MAVECEGRPQPTIRVNPGIFDRPSRLTEFYCDVLDLYASLGYQVVTGGTFNRANAAECGLMMREGGDNVLEAIVQLDMAERHGIATPKVIPYEQLPELSEPAIVKIPNHHRGKDKFKITDRNKLNFLALTSFTPEEILSFRGLPRDLSDVIVAERKEELQNGHLRVKNFPSDSMIVDWLAQEFIPPHEFPTSVRVVADMHGTIHYALLLYTTQQTEPAKVPDLPDHPRNPFVVRYPFDHFRHPGSPFYLNSDKITANEAQGGQPIYLCGQQVSDPLQRSVLESQGLDPDCARLPEPVLQACSEMAVEGRRIYPFVGLDLINGRFFTEMNGGPVIPAEELGLPADTSAFAAQLEMIRVVHSGMPLPEYLHQQGRHDQSVFGRLAS